MLGVFTRFSTLYQDPLENSWVQQSTMEEEIRYAIALLQCGSKQSQSNLHQLTVHTWCWKSSRLIHHCISLYYMQWCKLLFIYIELSLVLIHLKCPVLPQSIPALHKRWIIPKLTSHEWTSVILWCSCIIHECTTGWRNHYNALTHATSGTTSYCMWRVAARLQVCCGHGLTKYPWGLLPH